MVKTKTKKKKRDPARPKRAMTPFLYYACEQRKILKESGEKLTLPEQSKRIALAWKSVTNKDKYIALSNIDKQRYVDEMSRYEPPKKIKRPRSSYAFFMKDMRHKIASANPNKNPRELMGDIAAAWKSASDNVKSMYTRMAVEDKERYVEEKNSEAVAQESI
tara:strand:+ start:1650 stop:2135 length:486 start_codon:yes stop_codon:yes gene_type:complete